MIMFTLDDDLVRPMIEKNFHYEHINISEKDTIHYKNFVGTGREFARLIGYDIYPTSVFLNQDNKIVLSVPGKQEEDSFLSILKYINTHAYEKMDLESFETKLTEQKEGK